MVICRGEVAPRSFEAAPRRPSVRHRGALLAVLLASMAATAGCDAVRDRIAGVARPVGAEELRAAATDPRVQAFYEARQWRPAWNTANARIMLEELEGAQKHGLDPTEFVGIIQAAEGRAERDAELTLAALAYAQALAHGTVDPTEIHSIYTLERPEVDVTAGLQQALEANDFSTWIASLAPTDAEYRALSDAYLTYHTLNGEAQAAPIPEGPAIRAGDRDPRTPLIAQRLMAGGYLSADTAASDADVFTPPMSEALKAFQQGHGLEADGTVGNETLGVLNISAADRARQLAVNLERRRWLARNPPATRIDVNTAAAELVYVRDDRPVWTTRTVAGTPQSATPAMGETFSQLVVNPPWNVPQGIAEREILPQGEAYLARNNMYVQDGRVVQRPGPNAALGLVKFDMVNPHAIYLHDTPAKALFQSEQRHRSHGCVRVEDAVEFARRLASESGKGDDFDAALRSGQTRVVSLGEDIKVRLLYHTAYLGTDGQVAFTRDVYGWDDRLAEKMGLGAGRTRGEEAPVAALLGP